MKLLMFFAFMSLILMNQIVEAVRTDNVQQETINPSGESSRRQTMPPTYRGLASWYGKECHGKTMANGEPYNMYGLTVAMRHLPINSVVRITNTENGRSVIVPVTDRGPYVGKRIADMSWGVAEILGALKPGVIPVTVEVLARAGT